MTKLPSDMQYWIEINEEVQRSNEACEKARTRHNELVDRLDKVATTVGQWFNIEDKSREAYYQVDNETMLKVYQYRKTAQPQFTIIKLEK